MMTLKEKIAYREAMREVAEDSQTMFNHYMDEYRRIDEEIHEETMIKLRERWGE